MNVTGFTHAGEYDRWKIEYYRPNGTLITAPYSSNSWGNNTSAPWYTNGTYAYTDSGVDYGSGTYYDVLWVTSFPAALGYTAKLIFGTGEIHYYTINIYN